MSTTTVLLRSEIDSKLQILLNEVQEKVDGLLNCQLSFLYGNSPIQANPSDALRVVSEMISDDSDMQTLKNLLINTVVTSESLWAGSGFISLIVLLEASRVLHKNRLQNHKIDYDTARLNYSVASSSRRVSSTDIIKSLKSLSSSPYELELVTTILDITGAASSAHISEKVGLNTVITVDEGYNFKIYPPELFWSASKASLVSLYNSKAVCIDGIVENISEVHSIMDQSFSTGQSVVLFARGFNDDVVNTLAVNHSQGKLNVIPIVIPYDVMGVNQLVDVAVCCGCDVVSSIKGELISTIEWDDLVDISRVIITEKGTSIENDCTLRRVASHKNSVQRKMNSTFRNLDEETEAGLNSEQARALEQNQKEQREVYQERIMSLMSGAAKIVLGKEHGSARGIRKDRIQTLLRAYSQSSKHGLVNLKSIDTKLSLIHI